MVTLSRMARSAMVVSILLSSIFLAGWGPADYVIHIQGNYCIFRLGHNRFSLVFSTASADPSSNDGYNETICEGIATYGVDNGIIYGTTVTNEFYLLKPPAKIVMYRQRDSWEDALGQLGVTHIELKVPSPPEEKGYMEQFGVGRWIVVLGAIGIMILLILWIHRRVHRNRPSLIGIKRDLE